MTLPGRAQSVQTPKPEMKMPASAFVFSSNCYLFDQQPPLRNRTADDFAASEFLPFVADCPEATTTIAQDLRVFFDFGYLFGNRTSSEYGSGDGL